MQAPWRAHQTHPSDAEVDEDLSADTKRPQVTRCIQFFAWCTESVGILKALDLLCDGGVSLRVTQDYDDAVTFGRLTRCNASLKGQPPSERKLPVRSVSALATCTRAPTLILALPDRL